MSNLMGNTINDNEECELDCWGNKYFTLKGQYHRIDGPAIEYASGAKHWYINGKRHRENGPAIEYSDGTKEWFKNGSLHREDGPAVEWTNGYKEWWRNGIRYPMSKYQEVTKISWLKEGF